MPELLEFDNVSVTYGTGDATVHAVSEVDLVVKRGEIVGLAGESGCGKSSLGGAVLRLLPATAHVGGRVLVEGRDVQGMGWGALRALRWAGASIVFQGALHSLNPVHRVGQQVAEPLRIHRPELSRLQVRARVVDLLEDVGLPGARASAYPHQLSGGQRQRVMIAMALACRPSLVIADEPTTALDVMVQAQVLDVLADVVHQRGVGTLLISHDLSVLADVCDRVAVMYAGRVVEHGPAGQVLDNALHPYAGALSAAFARVGDPSARYAPVGLAGDPPDPSTVATACSFAPRCPRAVARCAQQLPELRLYGPERAAACLRVREP